MRNMLGEIPGRSMEFRAHRDTPGHFEALQGNSGAPRGISGYSMDFWGSPRRFRVISGHLGIFRGTPWKFGDLGDTPGHFGALRNTSRTFWGKLRVIPRRFGEIWGT